MDLASLQSSSHWFEFLSLKTGPCFISVITLVPSFQWAQNPQMAVQPEVLLMDEPCSALDPIATLKIEELITELTRDYTIVIVTHNLQQASRVAQFTGFFLSGKLIEYAPTVDLFEHPRRKETEDYISGRFG